MKKSKFSGDQSGYPLRQVESGPPLAAAAKAAVALRGAAQLGAAFELRTLHEVVLGSGVLPLTVSEWKRGGWVSHARGR